MNSIHVYFGPKRGFDNFLSQKVSEDITTFSTLVKKSDERNREYRFINDAQEERPKKEPIIASNLVVFADDYASVKEHVISNFDGFITEFIIENIYLQNPPESLFNKIKKSHPNTVVTYYNYSSISENTLIEINDHYDKVIIGQPYVLNQLLISLVPLTRNKIKKPIVLLFWGPSGVGKTETAKFLATKLGGELFRKQLSMFQNNDFITYLFGGNHYEKSFAKELLERETNVILLDEFDKANPVFHSAFYQLFDEGIYEDKNYVAHIGSSIIICTSNYNSLEHIREHLGDPIFSRFDACIQFHKLNEQSIKRIIDFHIEEQYNELDDNDKTLISKEVIQTSFYNKIDRFDNARRIKSLVKEVINSKILDRILNNSNQIAKND